MKNNFKNIFIIAEIGTNHTGSVDVAKKIIDVATLTGAIVISVPQGFAKTGLSWSCIFLMLSKRGL